MALMSPRLWTLGGRLAMAASIGLLLCHTHEAKAAEWHVAVTGDDSTGDGSVGDPYKTINKAVQMAVAGDTVYVGAGTYHECVVFTKSGTAGNPITFVGERGPNGEWETVVDPSESLDSVTWDVYDATNGVYRTDDLRDGSVQWKPAVLTLNGQHVARLSDNMMNKSETDATGGIMRLKYDRNAIVSTEGGTSLLASVRFWDVPYAAYGSRNDGYTYIRFRDKEDPNNLTLRAGRPKIDVVLPTKTVTLDRAAFLFPSARSYITVRDFAVRGAVKGFYIYNGSNLVIENNDLQHGTNRIHVYGSASSNNTIRGNRMTLGLYGYRGMGAYEFAAGAHSGGRLYDLALKQYFYLFFKFCVAVNGSTDDTAIDFENTGSGHEVYDNEIFAGGQGINVGTMDYGGYPSAPTSSSTRSLKIHHNHIRGMSSYALHTGYGKVFMEMYENDLYDNQFGFRAHDLDLPEGSNPSSPRYVCFYRNRMYNPNRAGTHIFFNYDNDNSDSNSENVYLYIYHNSLAGGYSSTDWNGFADENGGLPNARVINNIFNANHNQSSSDLRALSGGVAAYDYNWWSDANVPAAVWYGANNVKPPAVTAGSAVWPPDSPPTWHLPSSGPGSLASDAAVNLATTNNSNFKFVDGMALPGLTDYYIGTPDIGAVQVSDAASATHRIKLRFDNSGSDSENLIDFPVLVKLNSSRIDYGQTQNNGYDLRFTDSDGVTPLKHEIELWNEAGDSYVWVKVPRINRYSTTDHIYLYYGNGSLGNGQDAANVWNAGYRGVWHVNATATNQRLDSTANAMHLTATGYEGDEDDDAGKIGKGDDLAANDSIRKTSASLGTITDGAITLEMWVKPVASDTAVLAAQYTGGDGFRLRQLSSPDRLRWEIQSTTGPYLDTDSSPAAFAVNAWTYVAVTNRNSTNTMVVYLNGEENNRRTDVPSDFTAALADLCFGGLGTSTLDGMIDEIRLSTVERSAAWIKAQHASMTDSLIAYGEAQELDYDYRIRIGLLNSTNETLADFPLLVKLTTARMNYAHAQSLGQDIRFTASDGATPLKHEIELWNPSGDSYIWVNVPRIDAMSADGCIYMYYGDLMLADGQDADAVWDADFKAVWHFKEGGTGTRFDSTTNAHHASPYSYGDAAESVDAMFGKGDDLEGGSSNERLTVSINLSVASTITVEGWVRPGSTASAPLVANYTSGSTGYRLHYTSPSRLQWQITPTAGTSLFSSDNAISTSGWQYVVATFDETTDVMMLYIGDAATGILTGWTGANSGTLNPTSMTPLTIGGLGSNNFDGIVDEFRISDVARSTAWVEAQFRSMTDTFTTFGIEESP